MPRMLGCARGHRWEEANVASPPSVLRCPVCGSPARSFLAVNSQAADESTILQKASGALSTGVGDQPAPKLPDFEILGELGRGGMGIVYKARQRSEDRVIALKVIRKDRLQHEEAVRRFRREAQAAARLLHPNIVRLFDSDHTGDTHFLVMEFVDGVTLERLVERDGRFPVAQACDFIRQAAVGLQHAQEMGLVHRDIKPSNLMVVGHRRQQSGGGGQETAGRSQDTRTAIVKILDMGVARVLGGAAGESFSTLTQGGAVIGTADYVAPEQLEDPHGADIRADLYSLGCTFYFLLTGQVPFPGGSLVSKLDKQRWQTPTSIHQLRDDVPPAVVAVVEKLMAKDVGDRFQAPTEVARALDTLARSGYTGAEASVSLKSVQCLAGHEDGVLTVAFSPDGRLLASAGKDRQLLLWDAATGVLLRKFPLHPQEVRAVLFTPDGSHLVSASGITLRVFDSASGAETRRLAGHTKAVKCLAVSPDGRLLASSGEDRTIRIWELQSGRDMQRFTRHTGEVTGLAFLSDGDHLLSCSRDQTMRLWDLRSGQEERHIATGSPVLAIATSADGRMAVSAHFDTLVRVWDLETGQELRRLVGHRQMVTTVAVDASAGHCTSGSQDHTVRLWDLHNGRELACVPDHKGGINAVALSPARRLLASASADRTIGLWQLPE